MAKKRRRFGDDPIDCAWGLFQNTGDVGFYLLYRRLVDEKNRGE